MNAFSMNSQIVIPEHVLFRDAQNEAVLLNLESGIYFGLNEVATRMWKALAAHGKVEPAFKDLATRFEVSEIELRRDLFQLLATLSEHGLMEITEPSQPDHGL